jgi:hypothetical protein
MPAPALRMRLGDGAHIHEIVALVEGFDLDLGIRTERMRLRAMLDQRVDAGQAIGGNVRASPLNDVAIGVVMRRLDQRDSESARPHGKPIPRIKSAEPDLPSTTRLCRQADLLATDLLRLLRTFSISGMLAARTYGAGA